MAETDVGRLENILQYALLFWSIHFLPYEAPHILNDSLAGNYGLIIAILAVYALISNPLLLIALGFLVGGFAAINRFGTPLRCILRRVSHLTFSSSGSSPIWRHSRHAKAPLYGSFRHRPPSVVACLTGDDFLLVGRSIWRRYSGTRKFY